MKRAILASLLPLVAAPAFPSGPGTGTATPELVLQYDFYDVGDGTVFDGAGRGRAGTLVSGDVVVGRNKPAVRLAGRGSVTMTGRPALELASQPLTVGAMCRPEAPDGVIVAMGDERDGFSLYLRDGVPHFAVRAGGGLREVAAPEPLALDRWAHVAGVVDASGSLALLVDTWPVATAVGHLLSGTSVEPLVVGADPGSFVGGYASPLHWRGLLQDVRVYRGVVSREDHRDLLGEWAQRPGCGCRE